MATIANLLVEISTKDSNLRKGLAKANATIGKFAHEAAITLSKIAKRVSLAVTAATAILMYSINKTSAEIDKLAKVSSKLGIGVGELQKLQYQAKISGVSMETLNMSLQRMVRRVAEAAQGTGEAVKALEELGLDAERLNRASPDEQFNMIADAMKRIPTQADKVRLAMKLFDSEGVALVNTLNQDLRTTGDEFEKLGIKITDTDAKMVEAFNDSKTKLATIWDGFKQQVTAQVAPAFKDIIEYVTKTIKEMGGIKKISLEIALVTVKAVTAIINAFQFLGDVLKGIKVLYESIALAGTRIAGGMAKLIQPIAKASEAASQGKSIQEIAKIYNEESAKADQYAKEIEKAQQDKLGAVVDSIGDRNKILSNMAKLLEKQIESLEKKSASSKAAAGATSSKLDIGQGYGSITDLATGKTIQIGKQQGQQNVNVQIVADKERLVNAVVTSDQFRNTLQTEAAAATRDAARATRR